MRLEKNVENVRRAVQQIKIDFPIAVDNDYGLWRAFNNHRLELSVARELIRLVSQSRSFWAQEGQAVRRPTIRRRAWLS